MRRPLRVAFAHALALWVVGARAQQDGGNAAASAVAPLDPARAAEVLAADRERLNRPAEAWSTNPEPLEFPWTAQLAGPPVRTALLCLRWGAYETMELARRLEMDVRHQYFGSKKGIARGWWPYSGETGIGSLGEELASRQALRICADASRDVFVVCCLNGTIIPEAVMATILERVRAGKGLVITGRSGHLGGWPDDLTANPDPSLLADAVRAFPWEAVPGLRWGESGRIGDAIPWQAYRYGKGRVVIFIANIGLEKSTLIPFSDAAEGLDGAMDRLLAMHGRALLTAAGRELPASLWLELPADPIPAGRTANLRLHGAGDTAAEMLVRVQDNHDEVLLTEARAVPADGSVALPPLPGGRRYFVDVLLRDGERNALGWACAVVEPSAEVAIEPVELTPSTRVHPAAPPLTPLAEGGVLRCAVTVRPVPEGGHTVRCEVRDCFDRLVARGSAPVGDAGMAEVALQLPPAVTVCHLLDATLLRGGRPVAVRRERFNVDLPYPYDDFAAVFYSYPKAQSITRRTQRRCYELGAGVVDLCEMWNYSDEVAAREYSLAARSGLRLLPYVARIARHARDDRVLNLGLFDPAWIEQQRESIERSCRQAAPYRPVAYTLGDENILCRGKPFEACRAPETAAAYRDWLRQRYGSIAALNAAWGTQHADFAAVGEPMWSDEAAEQTVTFAPFIDYRLFMDTEFARCHETLAGFVRREDPGAKVGWDGFLNYFWFTGFDFHKLTRNLDVNNIYSRKPLQGELLRSFKQPGAFTGEWMNRIADSEAGFAGISWHNLFRGHNSVWWWSAWGTYYSPFNPDLSVSDFGRWFFNDLNEIRSGPGKLLLHATRDDPGIAIYYSHADLFAAELAERHVPEAVFASGDCHGGFLNNHRRLLFALEDSGYQYHYVAGAQLEAEPGCLDGCRVVFLPFATCLSDTQVKRLRAFVRNGGTLVADGRTGLLTGNGVVRGERPLDEVFGIETRAGIDAFRQASAPRDVVLNGHSLTVQVLEPDLRPAGGTPRLMAGETPLVVANTFGEGRALYLNFAFRAINPQRFREVNLGRGPAGPKPWLDLFGALLSESGLRPYCTLETADGRALCVEQTLFTDGGCRYLALQQDILRVDLDAPQPRLGVDSSDWHWWRPLKERNVQFGLGPRQARLTLPTPAIVYDVRAGKRVGTGAVRAWDVELSRGRPLLFALMPYEVAGVEAATPGATVAGRPLAIDVSVRPARDQFHVVHMAVYAPGAETPHRQYSQNIACPDGHGRAAVPVALNDPAGAWRLEFKDTASGMTATRTVRVAKPADKQPVVMPGVPGETHGTH